MATPRRSRTTVRTPAAATDVATVAAVLALADRVASAPLSSVDAILCRAVRSKYLKKKKPEPLYYLASARTGARFTSVGGPAGLYLATDQATAFAEIRDLLRDAAGRPLPLKKKPAVTLVYVQTRVHGVLDLTDASVQAHLGVTAAELRAEWQAPMEAYLAASGPLPLTQCLGWAAHLTGRVRGLWYSSARDPMGQCLCVLPDRLSSADGDVVWVDDEVYPQRLP